MRISNRAVYGLNLVYTTARRHECNQIAFVVYQSLYFVSPLNLSGSRYHSPVPYIPCTKRIYGQVLRHRESFYI